MKGYSGAGGAGERVIGNPVGNSYCSIFCAGPSSEMTLHLEIPDGLAAQLDVPEGGLGRAVLEGFAVEAFRGGRLSAFQVRSLLGHGSRWETQAFLSAHEAWPGLTADEVLSDAATGAAFALRK